MTPEDLVAQTAAKINALGAKFYFDPASLARGKEAGLDGFRLYILGRGGVLGDVSADVVSSAFGYFNPAVVASIWDSAREITTPMEAATLYLDCNADLGREKLADTEGLAAFCDAAEQVIADVAPAGLTLYTATARMPLPEDLPGRAMQLVVVHRELRGSLHLASIVAHGMDDAVAHALRRPDDVGTFGWADGIEIPDGSQPVLDQIDAATDAITANAYRSLSDAQRQAFVDGVNAIDAAWA
ncbi:MAG: hypothetical protein AAF567_18865 [Actinomycetota bacterium]